jgi:hypothetical protein
LAGSSAKYPWIAELIDLLDPKAVARDLDLALLQARYCEANDCDHLKTPLMHTITISGTAANNPAHGITTIQQPGVAPVGPMLIPGAPVAVAGNPVPIDQPGQRRFPILLGSTHAFVEVGIKDIPRGTRIICDCPKSKTADDLTALTGSAKPPPGVPHNPVLTQPFGSVTPGQWQGLFKRAPKPNEEEKFYAKKIAILNANWTEENVLKFLRRLYKAMHQNR